MPSHVSAPEQDVAAPVPHAVPATLFVPSMHTELPVAHDVIPILHELGFVVHVRPGVHDVHTPALQNRFDVAVGPHAVPSARTVIWSVQVAMPVAHDCLPAWHALAGLQSLPSTQTTHAPALQTMPLMPAGEQFVPAGLLPLSIQTELPVVHEVTPVLHVALGWQAWLAAHTTHIPVRHTMFVPGHDEPSIRFVPVSLHTALPVLHDCVPAWHGLPGGVHVAPSWQGTHAPVMHTMFMPHDVPFG